MNITMKASLTALACLLSLVSCGEKAYYDGSAPPWQVTLPTAVGVLWTYEVHDSLTGSIDTIQVSIVDTVTLATGTPAAAWKHNCPDTLILTYAAVAGNVLEVYLDTVSQRPTEHFLFPLASGSMWVGPLVAMGDTSRVTDSGVVSVPAGDFDNGARVDRSWGVGFEGGGNWSTTWIVPDVRTVYRYLLS